MTFWRGIFLFLAHKTTLTTYRLQRPSFKADTQNRIHGGYVVLCYFFPKQYQIASLHTLQARPTIYNRPSSSPDMAIDQSQA
ncbi:hypothetical protein GGR08_000547 [Bartonella fuyuanensis]|uniref:Uncharacterized protein n=1 Tax=Bartonella fuyuanensis TaxID=1460968 RepID=A0A840DT51_9HYPH|nr:hypothetical protein [Bartonella fuyuanensis]